MSRDAHAGAVADAVAVAGAGVGGVEDGDAGAARAGAGLAAFALPLAAALVLADAGQALAVARAGLAVGRLAVAVVRPACSPAGQKPSPFAHGRGVDWQTKRAGGGVAAARADGAGVAHAGSPAGPGRSTAGRRSRPARAGRCRSRRSRCRRCRCSRPGRSRRRPCSRAGPPGSGSCRRRDRPRRCARCWRRSRSGTAVPGRPRAGRRSRPLPPGRCRSRCSRRRSMGVQRPGQKPSPVRQGRGISEQTNVQRATSPVRVRMVSVSLLHRAVAAGALHPRLAGLARLQRAVVADRAPHSGSLVALQLAGQQLSPDAQLLMRSFMHRALQVAALPTSTRRVQDSAGQLVGQLPGRIAGLLALALDPAVAAADAVHVQGRARRPAGSIDRSWRRCTSGARRAAAASHPGAGRHRRRIGGSDPRRRSVALPSVRVGGPVPGRRSAGRRRAATHPVVAVGRGRMASVAPRRQARRRGRSPR